MEQNLNHQKGIPLHLVIYSSVYLVCRWYYGPCIRKRICELCNVTLLAGNTIPALQGMGCDVSLLVHYIFRKEN